MKNIIATTAAVVLMGTMASADGSGGGDATAVAGAAAGAVASSHNTNLNANINSNRQGQLQGQAQGQLQGHAVAGSGNSTVKVEGSIGVPSIAGGNGCSWGISGGVPAEGALGFMFGRVKCDQDRRAQVLVNAGRPDLAVDYLVGVDPNMRYAQPKSTMSTRSTHPSPRPEATQVRLTRCEVDASGVVRVGVPRGSSAAQKAAAPDACLAQLGR